MQKNIIPTRILITGGAGFIGSHVADHLLELGHHVSILDCLHPQIHGESQALPSYISPEAEFQLGDVCDPKWQDWIAQHEVVYHFASHTGVGQSMFELAEYTQVNCTGFANVLESALKVKQSKIRKVILSSSRAVYGEGAYQCLNCGIKLGKPRKYQDLLEGKWDVSCDICGAIMNHLPTDEANSTEPVSIYGLTKLYQEQMLENIANIVGLDYKIFRFFNVFGPRQAPNNPYTGVLMYFIKLAKAKKVIPVFEDGLMLRDYIHVKDVASSCANESFLSSCKKIENLGTGFPITLYDLACLVATKYDAPKPLVTGEFRKGDIRHCYSEKSLDTFDAGLYKIEAYLDEF